MKTKEVIRQLMEADPSGEAEVCVGNVDIFYISSEPAFYDGALQVLIRDQSKLPYYNVIGAEYKRCGVKINIHTLSISDAILNSSPNYQDFNIDYSELPEYQAEATRKSHEDLKAWCKKLKHESEWDYFLIWAKNKNNSADTEDVEETAWRFFEKNISSDDPLPDEGIPAGHSYISTRHMQWDQNLEVLFEEGFFNIRKKV